MKHYTSTDIYAAITLVIFPVIAVLIGATKSHTIAVGFMCFLFFLILWYLYVQFGVKKILRSTIVWKTFYELHLPQKNLSQKTVLNWLVDTLEQIEVLGQKDIVFEVSTRIIKPERVCKLFGVDNSVCKKASLVCQVYHLLTQYTYNALGQWRKSFPKAKLSNMVRYEIPVNSYEIADVIVRAKAMRDIYEKREKRDMSN